MKVTVSPKTENPSSPKNSVERLGSLSLGNNHFGKTMYRRCLNLAKEILRPFYLRWLFFRLFPKYKPEFFQNCWQYPTWRLSAQNGCPEIRADGSVPGFLFLPMVDWHARMQRSQHLALSLANQGHWSLYLNPHLGRQFPKIYAQDPNHRISSLENRLYELHLRLPREPVHYHRMLTRRENRILLDALSKIVGASPWRSVVQIVSLPTWLEIARALRAKFQFPIIYDCHDLLEGFREVDSAIVHAEEEIFRLCDHIIFSSEYLQKFHVKRDPKLSEKCSLLRNAADPCHFERAFKIHGPNRGSSSHTKVIGYIGALDDWFDVSCIELAATTYPAWRFWLVGRIEFESIRRLRRLSNVQFWGEVPYARLPEFLAEFDAALIPFRRNDLTQSASPIKLYEYFSCGLPVVSTRLPEVEQFPGLVYLADDAPAFVQQLKRAALEDNAALRFQRRQVALKEQWTARTEQLRDLAATLHQLHSFKAAR